jgi:hypothetical protein
MRRTAAAALTCVALAACSSGGTSSAPTTAKGRPGGGDGLSSLVAKAAKARYKVTYQSGSSTVVVAQDPPKYSLVQSGTAIYGSGDGTFVECSGNGSAATCAQFADTGDAAKQSLAGSFGSVGASLLDALSQAGSVFAGITTSDATIAGRDARCVSVDSKSVAAIVGDALKGTLTVCADKQTGVLLKSHVAGATGGEDIVATSFDEPSDSDFLPPATPITIPSDTTP